MKINNEHDPIGFMKLSIITVNYNNRAGLQKTIDSVVVQTWCDFEWIVIDGGSTDGSKELIEQYQDHITYWCSEPDNGIFNAMNKGTRFANADYCLFLNSGDRLHSRNVVQEAVPFLHDYDYICGDECVVDLQYNQIRVRKNPEIFDKYHLLVGCLWHQSTFIRTSLLKERPYDETFKIVGDWETSFYQLVLHDATYKHIPVLVSDFVIGGVSTDLQYAGVECRQTINQCLSRRQQDLIALAHFDRRKTDLDKRQMSETAYTAFANGYYSQNEYIDIFAPYREILVSCSSIHHRFFNFMCLSGYMKFARTIYRCMPKRAI